MNHQTHTQDKGAYMSQLQLKVHTQIPAMPNRKNATYGKHEEFSGWVDTVLALPAIPGTYGMLAKDILTVVMRSGDTRKRVCTAWGVNSSSLGHSIVNWDKPLSMKRQATWAQGCHLLDLGPDELRAVIDAKVKRTAPTPTRKQAQEAPRDRQAGIELPAAVEVALEAQPVWAPWAYWAAGFAVGGYHGRPGGNAMAVKKIPCTWLAHLPDRCNSVLVQGLAPRPWEDPITVLEYVGMDGSKPATLTQAEGLAIIALLKGADQEGASA